MPTINTTPYTLVHVDGYGRVITGTNLEFIEGDVRGSINSSTVSLNLRSTGITPGTYGGVNIIPQITLNNKGIVTAISNVDSSYRNYITISGDAGADVVNFTDTLTFSGITNQISSTVTNNTVTYRLTNNVTIPGILTANSIVANSLSSTGAFVGNLTGNVTGNVVGNLTGNQTSGTLNATTASFSSSLSVSGISSISAIAETLNSKTAAAGTVTHDFSTGAIWYHSGMTANFTVNLTNIPTTNNRIIGVNLLLQQGTTGYYPSAFQIDGVSQTIKWQDSTAPTASSSRLDVVNFTLLRISSVWVVTGSLVAFG
jgi:hypothetical protein